MLVPYGTDAPIYHLPYATIGIIAINAAMFVGTGMGDCVDSQWLILEYDRINPLQWLTGAFMHASWLHLIGNMIFLWCFGLVLEGKLGALRFGFLYAGLALADGAIGQIPMFLLSDGQGGALGASGVIFALIAVAMVWAPMNDIHVFYWLCWIFIGTFEVPIYAMALFYFFMEFLQLWCFGFEMSTPMLHLMGMTVGLPFAIGMLKYQLVDCEGWDLFTRLEIPLKSAPPPKAVLVFQRALAAFQSPELRDSPADCEVTESGNAPRAALAAPLGKSDRHRDPCVAAIESFRRAIRRELLEQAIAAFEPLRKKNWVAAVGEPTLVSYVKLLTKHARYVECLSPLRLLVARRSTCANEASLRIASIELKHNQDPHAAVVALNAMPLPLNERARRKRDIILAHARRQLGSTVNQSPST